jgi:hypothetical protein
VRFGEEWPRHPRKVAREKCLSLWRRRRLEAKAGAILDGLRRAKGSRDWQKDGGEFIVAPHRWLNESRWEAAAAGAAGGGSAPVMKAGASLSKSVVFGEV